jgi:hypothetical protein
VKLRDRLTLQVADRLMGLTCLLGPSVAMAGVQRAQRTNLGMKGAAEGVMLAISMNVTMKCVRIFVAQKMRCMDFKILSPIRFEL